MESARHEHAELRHRVRQLLASCAGEVVAGAPQLPPVPMLQTQAPIAYPGGPLAGASAGPGGGLAPPMARSAASPQMAHMELQRTLLSFLVQRGGSLALPVRAEELLGLMLDHYPELRQWHSQLSGAGVERALAELQALVPHAVQAERGELARLDTPTLASFQDRLRGRHGPACHAGGGVASCGADKGGRLRGAPAAQDGEMAEVRGGPGEEGGVEAAPGGRAYMEGQGRMAKPIRTWRNRGRAGGGRVGF